MIAAGLHFDGGPDAGIRTSRISAAIVASTPAVVKPLSGAGEASAGLGPGRLRCWPAKARAGRSPGRQQGRFPVRVAGRAGRDPGPSGPTSDVIPARRPAELAGRAPGPGRVRRSRPPSARAAPSRPGSPSRRPRGAAPAPQVPPVLAGDARNPGVRAVAGTVRGGRPLPGAQDRPRRLPARPAVPAGPPAAPALGRGPGGASPPPPGPSSRLLPRIGPDHDVAAHVRGGGGPGCRSCPPPRGGGIACRSAMCCLRRIGAASASVRPARARPAPRDPAGRARPPAGAGRHRLRSSWSGTATRRARRRGPARRGGSSCW